MVEALSAAFGEVKASHDVKVTNRRDGVTIKEEKLIIVD